jgi:hypothetical protein
LIFRLKFSRLLLLFSAFLLPTFTTATFAANRVTLTAEPSEVAAGSGSGKTRIRWESVEEARLFVVKEDNSLVQVGKGRSGVYQENYIFPNQTYEYRLYPADNSDVPLAAVTVVGTQKVNYSPDFQTFNQKLLTPWGLPLIVIFALLFGARYLARRQKRLKLQKVLITSALFLAVAGATVVIGRARAVPYEIQPSPDAQETMDAARQMFEGNGYVTFYHENKAQPPRYPPSFSIALLPFASFGEYPTNIMFGAKFFALLYLAMAIFAAWMLGGRMAAMLAAIFVGVSPFAEHYARIVMSETFTASLILLTVVLLHKPSRKKIIFAGAIVGFLVTVRLQMLVCLPALLMALPTMRQRVWAALSAAPFLLANGIFNWRTYGGFFTTGYNYWLPNIKSFAIEFAFRAYPQGDGPWIIPDLLRGWLMVWICPCEKGGTLAALPNIILYPLILLGVFWIFAPPFVPLYGLWSTWKNRREPAAKFTIWLSGFSVLLFTFYFYQAARFMAAVSTVLLVFAAVELGKKLQRFIQPVSTSDSVPHLRETQADGDKNFVNSQTN